MSAIFFSARRVGTEVAGWNEDRKIRARIPAYPHHVFFAVDKI